MITVTIVSVKLLQTITIATTITTTGMDLPIYFPWFLNRLLPKKKFLMVYISLLMKDVLWKKIPEHNLPLHVGIMLVANVSLDQNVAGSYYRKKKQYHCFVSACIKSQWFIFWNQLLGKGEWIESKRFVCTLHNGIGHTGLTTRN